jgi:DNA polymerase-3 subunit alpha
MAFVTVEDLYGSVECVCFPKIYDKMRSFLEQDKVVSLTGKISIDEEKAPVIIVEKIWEFSTEEKPEKTVVAKQAREQAATAPVRKADKDKTLWLNITAMDEADVEELMETLTFYEGETQVIFVKDGKKLMCSEKVTPNNALMAELASFLPKECVKLV